MIHQTRLPRAEAHGLAGHVPALTRFARRLEANPAEAEDLVQETLIRGLSAARAGRAPGNLRAYLFQTIRNLRTDRLRRKLREGIPDPEAEPSAPPRQETQLFCQQVLSAVAKMEAHHSEVLTLAACDGLSTRDIATRLSIPEGTVLSRLSRARQALRRRLKL